MYKMKHASTVVAQLNKNVVSPSRLISVVHLDCGPGDLTGEKPNKVNCMQP